VAVKEANATCPPGKVVIGGGGEVTVRDEPIALFESWPATTSSWRAIGVYYGTPSTTSWAVRATAICANA
jgi:hypothetical protein